MLQRWSFRFKTSQRLVIILLVGLVNGLIYVFVVPPWQHYDEPSHFEYVWLIANRAGLPRPGDFDQNMRLQVAQSMLDHGFYRDMSIHPSLQDAAASIGYYTQLTDPPFYYIVASLPLRLFRNQSVTFQMYSARLVSLCLYLAVILIGWCLMGELVKAGHPLQWMVLITLVLLPSFSDLMTAVNNDSGAVLAFSLFLWASIRLIRRGPSLSGIVFLFGTAALCYWMANTTWIAFPLILVVLLFSLLRGRWRPIPWILFLASVVVSLAITLSWGDAALWYRRTLQITPTRVSSSLAPLGRYVFQLDLQPQKSDQISIQQPLPPEIVGELRNRPVTLGGWIWSTQPMKAKLPALACDCGGKLIINTREVHITGQPQFFSLTTILPANARKVWVALTASTQMTTTQRTLFYDGLILIKGEWIVQDPPHFEDPSGKQGIWNGQPFTNLLQDPSAEQGGLGFHSWVNTLGMKIIPPWPRSYPSDALVSWFDWKGSGWYYKQTFSVLLRTFWAEFGWGNVPLLGSKSYFVLAVITLLGILGAVWGIWRRRHVLKWEIILLMGLALLGIWVTVILRGIGSLFGWALIPAARYAYPAILPTVLFLNVGCLEPLRILERWRRITPKIYLGVHLLFFIALDILSIFSLIRFYN